MTDPVEQFVSLLKDVRRSGEDRWTAKCPAHDDKHPSLSVSRGEDGRLLARCHAGCSFDKILSAVGMKASQAFIDAPTAPATRRIRKSTGKNHAFESKATARSHLERMLGGTVSGEWAYHDVLGAEVLYIVRLDDCSGGCTKTYRPLSRSDKKWHVCDPRGLLPLYNLPSLIDAKTVWVCEGEKCAELFGQLGILATTNAHGAEATSKTDWAPLAGKCLILCPDHGAAGEKHLAGILKALGALTPSPVIKIVRLPVENDGDDIEQFVQVRRVQGASIDAIRSELEMIATDSPVVEPETSAMRSSKGNAEWESPEPLGQFELPVFPLETLRSQFCPICPLWPMVAAVAEAYQVPIDLPAMLALAVGGAALSKVYEISITPDWWEPLNLFVVVVMEPGERKSAVFREMTAPLAAFEREECESLAPEIERNRADLRMLVASIKHAEQEAAKTKNAEKREEARRRAHELNEELRNTPVLAAPRRLADDATPEALAKLLHEQAGRIALLSPEGGVFEQMAGRYGDGKPNLDVYLKGHAGDDIRIDRISRPPEFVRQPALTVGLAVQPEVIRCLADKPGFRGRGLLARFVYSLPTSRVGYRSLNPESVPEAVKDDYRRCLHTCLRLRPHVDAEGNSLGHLIRMDADASAVLDNFRSDTERLMREGGELIGLRDWALKLPGAVCRIAAILHALEHASRGTLDGTLLRAPTMAAAVEIGKYLVEHAKAAFFEMGADPSIGLARRLLSWIADRHLSTFTRREAYRWLRGSIRSVDAVDEPLALLVRHGYVRSALVERQGPGRAPSPSFEVHPILLGQNGHIGQNSVGNAHSGHSVHSVQGSEVEISSSEDRLRGVPLATSAAVSIPDSIVGTHDQDIEKDVAAAMGVLGEETPNGRSANAAAAL